jgi:hypothetical protein
MPDEPYGYVVEIRYTHSWTWREATKDYGYEPAPEPWTSYITAGCGELTIFNTPESGARSASWEGVSPGATYRVIPVILDESHATPWTSVPPRN